MPQTLDEIATQSIPIARRPGRAYSAASSISFASRFASTMTMAPRRRCKSPAVSSFLSSRVIASRWLLIRAASVLKIPTIVSTQYAKGLGNTVPEIASLLPETEAIDKDRFSCFGSEVFCTLLKRLPGNRNTLLLCGMESHICVAQTALAALREGYLVHVASDAVGSRTEWNWKIGLERMRAAGAVISSTEMMIYELMRSSSSPAFKEMLPHLKG